MRTIKFRAYSEERGMIYSPPLHNQIDGSVICQAYVDGGKLIDLPLMQFTGLQDKNGKDIYEGDIVKLKTIDSEKGGWYSSDKAQGVVEFNDVWGVRFVCKDHTQRTADTHWESKSRTSREVNHITIIGNIYENPELLTNKTT